MPDASHDFGAHLRQAREQRGVTLRAIAERTKISVLALEALERNDVSRLPGGIFTRAFVRSYAREVGLDPEDTVRRFVARFPEACAEEAPRAYEANPEHIEVDDTPTFGRAWRAVIWSLPLLAAVAYFGLGGSLPSFTWPSRQPAAQPAAKAEQPHPPVPPPPAPAPAATEAQPPAGDAAAGQPASPVATPGAQAASPDAGAAAGGTGAVSPAVPVGVPPAGATVPASTDAAAPQLAAGMPALQPGGFRLTLAPKDACWVSVRVNGASVFSGLMRPGERKDLALQGQVSLTVGNAGAFDFFINDQPGRSLGAPGQVVTARVTAENLKTFLEAR